jgi:GAF domain-containing protein
MAENLVIDRTLGKEEKYSSFLLQVQSLIEGETDEVAVLANVSAALRQTFNFFWVGFYRVVDNNTLLLGPFQGDIACFRIEKGKGVCGTAWQQKKTVVVPDVHQFKGHIACSALTNSEIVVPVFDRQNEVKYVLDIDSTEFNQFDEVDQKYLEKLALIIKTTLF